MTDYEYIFQQVKKAHFSKWDDEELRKCVDMLVGLERQELVSLYMSKWIAGRIADFKDELFHLNWKKYLEEK